MTGKPEDDGIAEIKRLLRSLDEVSAGEQKPSSRPRLREDRTATESRARAALEKPGPELELPLPAPPSAPLALGRLPPPPTATPRKPASGPLPLAVALVAAIAAAGGLGAWWLNPGLLPAQLLSARATGDPALHPRPSAPPSAPVATASAVAELDPPRREAAKEPASQPSENSPAVTPPSRIAQAVRSQSAVTEPQRPPPPAELKLRTPARLAGLAGQTIPVPIEIDGSLALPTAVVVIAGLPPGGKLSKGAPRPAGDWSLSASEIAGLTLALPSSATGRHQLTIELRSIDAVVLASVKATLEILAPAAKAPMADAVRPPETTSMEWLAEAKRLMNAGHIASARLVLERAADAGLAEAARLLGDSHDPAKLYALGVRGMSGDIAKAIHWYERADELGDPQAKARLLALGAR